MNNRKFWMKIRQALLLLIDAIEERYSVQPRTSELRKFVRDWFTEQNKRAGKK